MGIEKYATKEDIASIVQLFDSTFTAEQIKDTQMKIANSFVDQLIISHGIRPNNIKDRFNLLWSATICMNLELLCNYGQVSWTTGDIALEKLNRVTYQYQRWQPMFFFAQGAAKTFKGLLPHQTYLMMAYAFVEQYCNDDFLKNYGTARPIPIITKDETSRGWGWNNDTDFMEEADDESEVNDFDDLPY